MAQFAYIIDQKFEPFARYDYVFLPEGSTTGLTHFTTQEITLGANYYIHKQNAKVTLDATWLPVGSPVDSDALGILKDNGHNEFVLRLQFQIWI